MDRIRRRFATAIVAAIVSTSACSGPVRPAVHYIVPEGYVGWVRIDYGIRPSHAAGYGVARAPELPVVDGVVVASIPASGHLVTESDMKFGSARDRFYYSNGGTLHELSQATGSNMIWNKFNGSMGGGAASQTEMFFVGSEAEYMKHGYRHDPVPKHGPVTR